MGFAPPSLLGGSITRATRGQISGYDRGHGLEWAGDT
jgi:hypothetical protein